MIGNMTAWILDALRAHGGWSVFLGVLVEQVIIPIPSPAIIMGAGAILVPRAALWPEAFVIISLQVVLPGVAASALGAIATYYVGRYGGKVFVDRFQNFLGFTWDDVEALGAQLSKRGEAASLFFLRAAPIVPLSLISVAAGVLEVPKKLFIVWSILGTIPRCYLLGFLGWQMGTKALELAQGVDHFEKIFSAGILLVIVLGIVYLRRRVRKGLSKRSNGGGDAA